MSHTVGVFFNLAEVFSHHFMINVDQLVSGNGSKVVSLC